MVKVVDAADDAQTNYNGYYILCQDKKESSEK